MTPASVKPSHFADVFSCCRRGDIDTLKYLLEEKEININVRDEWDSTPLYYACLCGHLETVEYLLASGARCDASTFDGERCIYGALTDEIRRMLQDNSMLTSTTKRREPHQEFLRRLLEDEDGTDFAFHVSGGAVGGSPSTVRAHKFLLSARCAYFAGQFRSRWRRRRSAAVSGELVDAAALRLLMEWLYTARVKVELAAVDELRQLCRQCKLKALDDDLEEAEIKAKSYVSSKRGSLIRHLQLESDAASRQLEVDLRALAERAVANADADNHQQDNDGEDSFDVVFDVQGRHFRGHRVVFSKRSDFFQALLADHFQEGRQSSASSDSPSVTTVPLREVRPEVFQEIVRHIYSNTQNINPGIVFELLEAADMCLLPGLKRQCGAFLGSASAGLLELDTAVGLVRTARLYDLPRLEHICTEFMARNIAKFVNREDFRTLVVEDASGVVGRQETDSIDIVDEIRFVIRTDGHDSLSSAVGDAIDKLDLIEDMLIDLGFAET